MAHRETLEEDYEFSVRLTDEGGYSVSLPHQCDDWEIVGADVWSSWSDEPQPENVTRSYPNLPKDKDLAVRQMELFIKRAKEALVKLQNL